MSYYYNSKQFNFTQLCKSQMLFKVIIHAEFFRKAFPLQGNELGLPTQLFQKVIDCVSIKNTPPPQKKKLEENSICPEWLDTAAGLVCILHQLKMSMYHGYNIKRKLKIIGFFCKSRYTSIYQISKKCPCMSEIMSGN